MTKQKGSSNSLLLVAVVLLLGFFGYKYYKTSQINKVKNEYLPKLLKKAINNDKIKFSFDSLKEVSGVYQFNLTINDQKYASYISKDGKLLFPSVVKLDVTPTTTPGQTTNTDQPKKLTCKDIKKSKSANLTAYVVSQCPYGLQMQRVFKTAINEQTELEKFLSVKYIGAIENGKITSMHGDKEAQENLRQICIREEQKTLYWPYVSCYMQAGKSEECLANSGVDTSVLSSCISDKNKGLKYAQADFTLANKFKVSGSPTLVANNSQVVSEFDFGGRVANSMQDIVCCGSESQPSFCQNKISVNEVASSFSATDTASTQGTNQNANCSN